MKKSVIASAILGVLLMLFGILLFSAGVTEFTVLGVFALVIGLVLLIFALLCVFVKEDSGVIAKIADICNICGFPLYMFLYFLMNMIAGSVATAAGWIVAIFVLAASILIIVGFFIQTFSKNEKLQNIFKLTALIFFASIALCNVFDVSGGIIVLGNVSFFNIITVACYIIILIEKLDFKLKKE